MAKYIHRGRITSLHGFTLPPKKMRVVNRYITIRFAIGGTIPSKKNMIWADSNFNLLKKRLYSFKAVKDCIDWLSNNIKIFIRNSKKYTDWVEENKPLLIEQAVKEKERYSRFGIEYPLSNVSVKVYHYWADNMGRDNSNKYDTIIDLFVACGIITDDCWQVVQENGSKADCYHGEILDHITTIDVTVRL
jgi:hypothetical protein